MYHPKLQDGNSPLSPLLPLDQSPFNYRLSPSKLNSSLLSIRTKNRLSSSGINDHAIDSPNISPIEVHFEDQLYVTRTPANSPAQYYSSPATTFSSGIHNHNIKTGFTPKLKINDGPFATPQHGLNMSFLRSPKNNSSKKYTAMPMNNNLTNIMEKLLTVNSVLFDIGMSKYSDLFQMHEVFLTMDEAELYEIGIKNETDRKTIFSAIKYFQ